MTGPCFDDLWFARRITFLIRMSDARYLVAAVLLTGSASREPGSNKPLKDLACGLARPWPRLQLNEVVTRTTPFQVMLRLRPNEPAAPSTAGLHRRGVSAGEPSTRRGA
jgi:hypothetical protein